MTIKTELERRLYKALKTIAKDFLTPDQIRLSYDIGLDKEEEIQAAYENIQEVARAAIKGVRLPKPQPLQLQTVPVSNAQIR